MSTLGNKGLVVAFHTLTHKYCELTNVICSNYHGFIMEYFTFSIIVNFYSPAEETAKNQFKIVPSLQQLHNSNIKIKC